MIGVTNGSRTAHLMVVMCVHNVVKYAYMTSPVRQFALRSWMVSVVRLRHAGVGLVIRCCLPAISAHNSSIDLHDEVSSGKHNSLGHGGC